MTDPERLQMLRAFRSDAPLQPRKACAAPIGVTRQAVLAKLGMRAKQRNYRLTEEDYAVKQIVWAESDGRIYYKSEGEVYWLQEKYRRNQELSGFRVDHELVERRLISKPLGVAKVEAVVEPRRFPSPASMRSSSPFGRAPISFGSFQIPQVGHLSRPPPIYTRTPSPMLARFN
jgi:hypothetical protein